MLRDKNLIPLSHQHQAALALCVRVDRASPISGADVGAWQAEIAQHFRDEIAIHFEAEEAVLFPTARPFGELVPLLEELLQDHWRLRQSFAQAEAGQMKAADLTQFARELSAHIRKEERQLFEQMQALMTEAELADLGLRLEDALKNTARSCRLPRQR